MSGRARRAGLFVLALLVVALLPLLGRALRSGGAERCAFDGVRVPAATRVRVLEGGGGERPFCCVDCARRWIARTEARPRAVLATDEDSGREVDAADAWFVESPVPALAVTGCYVHVFATEAAARRHAADFRGRVLEGAERPFPGR